MFLSVVAVLLTVGLSDSTNVPDYFQTTPELFPGPTATGLAPFLAEYNPEFIVDGTFKPNAPLETSVPIKGDNDGTNIFQLQGIWSPYFPNPDGFGVKEYPLPKDAKISQLHMLHRHGSRYPATNSTQEKFGRALAQAIKNGGAKFKGELSFLNSYEYVLGLEELVSQGRQELYDSGVLHYYNYGRLYDTNTKIISRTTSQDRMLKSAENFLAGFFGLEWTKNATLEVIIEKTGFNDSLVGSSNCKNANTGLALGGTNASVIWENKYLPPAVNRFNALSENFVWNVSDAFNAQLLCAFETVGLGYSPFCDLFTLDEWRGFEYAYDIFIAGNYMFQSPTGKALGSGYVDEFLARLQHRYLFSSPTQANVTLDNNPTTFPLDQTLYLDFSHISTITSVLTAFGLTQFAQFLPTSGPPPNQQLIASHFQPEGAVLDIEIIDTPHPVPADRKSGNDTYVSGGKTRYVHFILNQRTIPLGVSLPECGKRADGWCEFDTFLKTQKTSVQDAEYDYACNGNYPPAPYGAISNGVPLPTSRPRYAAK